MGPFGKPKGRHQHGAVFECHVEDLEFEYDDATDFVERIRTAKHFGRDPYLQTDADFD